MHDIDRTMLELENGGFSSEAEGYLGDSELEMEEGAAQQFLELESEEELEGFLGGLLSRAAGALGNIARNPAVQKTIKSTVQGALRGGIPALTEAVGKRFLGPQGGTWGQRAGKSLAAMLGLEDEGELEVARRITRTMFDAARKVVPLVQQGQPAQVAARNAAMSALGAHLPGIGGVRVQAQSGRWIRENGRVVLLGL